MLTFGRVLLTGVGVWRERLAVPETDRSVSGDFDKAYRGVGNLLGVTGEEFCTIFVFITGGRGATLVGRNECIGVGGTGREGRTGGVVGI